MALAEGAPLINLANGAVLSPRVQIVSGLRTAWGLRFAWSPPKDAFVFLLDTPRAVTIDMWWVFVPLDIIAVDADGTVVGLRGNLRPFRVWRTPPCSVFIEAAAGTIARTGTRVGDRIGQ